MTQGNQFTVILSYFDGKEYRCIYSDYLFEYFVEAEALTQYLNTCLKHFCISDLLDTRFVSVVYKPGFTTEST